jgi:hypothetical protein
MRPVHGCVGIIGIIGTIGNVAVAVTVTVAAIPTRMALHPHPHPPFFLGGSRQRNCDLNYSRLTMRWDQSSIDGEKEGIV